MKGKLKGKTYTSDEVNDLLEWKEEMLTKEFGKKVAEFLKGLEKVMYCSNKGFGKVFDCQKCGRKNCCNEERIITLFNEVFGCEKPMADAKQEDKLIKIRILHPKENMLKGFGIILNSLEGGIALENEEYIISKKCLNMLNGGGIKMKVLIFDRDAVKEQLDNIDNLSPGSENPKCLICGKSFVNAVDSHTKKVSEYLWKSNCEHNRNLRMSIG